MSDNRKLKMLVRQLCIMLLGGLEDDMGLPRSIVPRRKRVPLRDNETVTGMIGTRWNPDDGETGPILAPMERVEL